MFSLSPLELSHGCPFSRHLFLIVEVLQMLLLDAFLKGSWIVLVGWLLLRRFTTVPFVDNGAHHGSLEAQSLRNGFVTLSRLIDVCDFVCHLFLGFLIQHV